MKPRLTWIDQARGFSIFLVVYGHNAPAIEPYIYSFHVPLFFLISGIFHPKQLNGTTVYRRFKSIMLPYFVWASLLFIFWVLIGKNYGDSQVSGSSITDNFIGIFYAQGGGQYMEWGIPLWFLPCVFVLYLIYAGINLIKNRSGKILAMLLLVLTGFLWGELAGIHLPWSFDVAMVAIAFYGTGSLMSEPLKRITKKQAGILLPVFLAISFTAFYFNPEKVDMYRSIYGNELLFLSSGVAGSAACLLFFRLLPFFGFLSYIGRNTIVILAAHLRAMTVIKSALFFVFGFALVGFTETEKLLYSILQIVVLLPLIWLVNKYVPALNGKIKKT